MEDYHQSTFFMKNLKSINLEELDLNKLKFLDYSRNLIKFVPKEIFEHNLIEVLLESNMIRKINPTSSSILSISLENNLIKVIPKNIYEFKSICFLNLSKNNIKNIPKSIKKCYNLKFLSLSYNRVKKFNLKKNFSDLNLSYNKIRKFKFRESSNTINVSNNKIKKIMVKSKILWILQAQRNFISKI